MASKVSPRTGEPTFKNKARRITIANAATRYTDAMKLSKRTTESHNGNNEKHSNARRRTVANVATTYTNCMKLRKQSDEKTKESDSSTDISSQSSETDEMDHAVADVATTFMNGMKLRKDNSVSENGDTESKSKDNKCLTCKKPFKKSKSFELPRHRFPTSANSGRKTFKKAFSFELPDSRPPTSTEGSKPNDSTLVRINSFKRISQSISGLLRLRSETMLKSKQLNPEEKYVYENTYKMSPDSDQQFAVSAIEQIAKDILKEEIGDRRYDRYFVGDMTRIISEKIQTKVKDLKLSRYRIVCQVVIAEITDQGIESASRCLWDERSDNFTTVTHRNENICATAMIFGIYFE